jgi:CrcB protein
MEGFTQVLIQFKALLFSAFHLLSDTGRALQPALKKVLLVMGGGGLGAASRYGISLLSARIWGTNFPWGTLVVNLTGCFLIGLLFALADRARFLTPDMRLLLITGYLGALTTFSTFSLETVSAGRSGMVLLPLINIFITNAGCIGFTFFGIWLGGLK